MATVSFKPGLFIIFFIVASADIKNIYRFHLGCRGTNKKGGLVSKTDSVCRCLCILLFNLQLLG
ncbi:hypothetical protein NC653_036054 [Populus alba x Populus x berolinensis]|uniref:Uncharacterized protein n=1 Tax=Populus alba x Populus x berolinensis TaxID=444605 RepID=A0AAD6LJA2_9ROSI|nr:hypothetical protein NC653_036054 [Populus alba x Populus x berolinensis]